MNSFRQLSAAVRTVLWLGPVGAMLLVLDLLIAASDAAAEARQRRLAAWRARRAYRRRPVPWIVAR